MYLVRDSHIIIEIITCLLYFVYKQRELHTEGIHATIGQRFKQ